MSGRIVLLLCGMVLLLLGGCTTTQKRLSAKAYYNKANTAFAHEDFATAADQYRELLDQYPLNPYAEEAQLKIAYAYYLDKKYTEAIAAFSDFERTYPTSSHLPFVEYFRGLCYLEQVRSIDRDQSVTEKAYEFFRTVTDHYVESPFAPLAAEKTKVCREMLAARELYIADFYKNTHPFASMVRLRMLVERYPETQITTIALNRINGLMIEAKEKELAALATKVLAARQATTPSPPQNVVASLATDGVPAPGADPLLQLVAELKKWEDRMGRKESATPVPIPAEEKLKKEAGEEEE